MSKNYLTTDYNFYTSPIAAIILSLEEQRIKLSDVRASGSNTAEISNAINHIEQSLLQLDHYIKRREKYGIYNLNIPETTERFESELRRCHNDRATDTIIRLYIDTPKESINTECNLSVGEMATVGELHHLVYSQLRGLINAKRIGNASPYYVYTDNDTNVTTLSYFVNLSTPPIDDRAPMTLQDVVHDIIINADDYYKLAKENTSEATNGKIHFLVREYQNTGISRYSDFCIQIGIENLSVKLANNDAETLERYTNIMLGIERVFKENNIVVFALSRLPGTLVTFSNVDTSVFDKITEVIEKYNRR